jgi:GGDEF domain-containing protein
VPDNEALAAIGRTLRGATASTDWVGRYGRAQFIVVLPGAGPQAAAVATERVSAALNAIRGLDAFAGLAVWERGTGADRLLGDADRELTAVRDKALRRRAKAVRRRSAR